VRLFLTGGAGFIGSHLAEALLARGDEVFCLDNFDPFYARSIKEGNLREALLSPRFRFVEGDFRDRELVRRLLAESGAEAVLHLGAKAGVRPSVEDPAGYVSANVEGTIVLLEAARELGIRKFLFASSSSVYGDDSRAPFSEDSAANRPASPYAATKKAGEELAHALHHVAGLDVVCLRYFTVYGPRQRPEMAIHKFARHLAEGRPITVFGGGLLERDFTYVSDVIAGTVAALDFLLRTSPCFEVFNLGNANRVRLDELLEVLQRTFGRRAELRYEERPAGDVERTWADVSKARRLLGYEPRVGIEEGVRLFAEWFGACREAAAAPEGRGADPARESAPGRDGAGGPAARLSTASGERR
jgi:UDP-glucuronate 4-epimerase